MKTDSTSAPAVENAYLDVSGVKSFFYGEKRVRWDSIMRRAFETRSFSFDHSQMEKYRTKIDYQIDKDLSAKKITFKNRIGRDLYAYDENRSFNWKILSETSKIGDYKVQKAETDFAGRHWMAWFASDIPFQDGPYKFSGLPGLIVKVEDSKGDYSFDLKEAKKNEQLPGLLQRFGNTIVVKRKDYEKQIEKFRKDPASIMRNTIMRGGGFRINGTDNNPQGGEAKRRKRMEERIREEVKNNNNPIELAEKK